MNALNFEHVYFKRGYFTLSDANFSIEEGETLALCGRSGCGKTTLIELMGNVIAPAGGRILYFGRELCEAEEEIRKEMSFFFERPNFNTEQSVEHFVKVEKKFEPFFDEEGFYARMKFFGLDPKKRIKIYSKGMRKKLMLSLALSRNPKLLVMDEPMSGLDEKSIREFLSVIEDYRKEHSLTVIFSTHNTDLLQSFASRVLTIENGGLR